MIVPPVAGSVVQAELASAFPYDHRVELGGDVVHAGADVVSQLRRRLQILCADSGQQALGPFHEGFEFGVIRDIPEIEAIQEFHQL